VGDGLLDIKLATKHKRRSSSDPTGINAQQDHGAAVTGRARIYICITVRPPNDEQIKDDGILSSTDTSRAARDGDTIISLSDDSWEAYLRLRRRTGANCPKHGAPFWWRRF